MMQKRIIPIILAVALLITGLISVFSIHGLQGNGRIINYAGVVRGATQRLVKQELNGQPNDALIAKLDGILIELSTGKGENGLGRLEDEQFQTLLSEMLVQWAVIQEAILQVRQGDSGTALYAQSEDFFTLADQTVSAAEAYSKRQVHRAEQGLVALSAVFLLLAALLAWYGAVQSKRHRALQEAEAENRAKSERLARMSEDLRAPMNDISELIYVADLETHELLFMNETGKQTFQVSDLSHQMCYQVLQGYDAPCAFCTTPRLVPGETYTWEFTNPLTKRHYLLKDRLMEWDGRPARMEIAFDITEAEAEKQSLKNMLNTEQMVMECVRTLYQEHDMARSFPTVLERLGRYLTAERVYLSMVRENQLFKEFEWFDETSHEHTEMSLLEFSPETLKRWQATFYERECLIIDDVDVLQEKFPEEFALLQSRNIHSLAVTPLEQDGQLRGVLVVDNPPSERIRGIASLLQTLCYFLMLAYRRTENEQQLSHLSYYDTLTSFYNRNRYIEDSAALIGQPGPVGVVYLDVNGLKDINDQRGHAFGDEVLIKCARQMREVFQTANYYRIGGDEFVIICVGIDRTTFEIRVAALRRRFTSNILCNAAIGAQWDEQIQDLEQIIARADAKMYEDKKEFYRKNPASNRYRHISDEVLHLSDPEVLQEEIRQERFVVYLQPKISSADRSAVGAEALIRYQSRSGSLILPGNFLPMLEESLTVSQIDFFVFEFACSQLKEWAKQGKQTIPVSVNFSRCSLSRPDFVAQLVEICQKYGVENKYLEIEITETFHEADGVDLKGLIHDLRQAGFVVSIDDFGTEYANLALLSTVEFDVLKLDKSLVDDVARNARARHVVESIVSICKKMQIQVVAEGIETEEQLTALRSCGVEFVQGFLFSKPIPIEEYEGTYL